MKVIAAPGLKVPTAHNPREYITDAESVEIEVDAYYLRRLADGELLEVLEGTITVEPMVATFTVDKAKSK